MRAKSLIIGALLIGVTPICSAQLRRPSTTGQLSRESILGHVLPSPGERAMPSASTITVTLKLLGAGLVKVESVREGGRFDFTDIPRGRYSLTVRAPGYQPATKELVVFHSLAGEPAIVYVNLGAPEEGDQVASSGAIDAQLLKVPAKALQALEKASKASQQNNTAQAIKQLQKALRIHPDFPQAYNNLAVQHLKLGDEKEALWAIGRSISILPEGNPMAYRNRGLIQLKNRSYQEAIDSLKKSLEQENDHPETLFNLGRAYFDGGNSAEAITVLERAVEIQPDNALARFALGYACFSTRDYEKATSQLGAFLQAEAEGPRADLARKLLRQIAGR